MQKRPQCGVTCLCLIIVAVSFLFLGNQPVYVNVVVNEVHIHKEDVFKSVNKVKNIKEIELNVLNSTERVDKIIQEQGKVAKKTKVAEKKENIRRKVKKILYWNDFYKSKNYNFCCRNSPYRKYNCEVKDCYVTFDRNTDLRSIDVVVFHGRSLVVGDVPKKRYPHQLYIFLQIESPAYPGKTIHKDWDNFFNISMTYRRDSDIVMPYGTIKTKEVPSELVPSSREKTGMIAWFVSNCVTHSRRETLVEKLKSFLPEGSIEIFGKCGSQKCPVGSESKSSCWKMVSERFKFYLSLENSLCKDYVTEKMFQALQTDVVPIVLGGADYKDMFPHQSYVDVQDFSSMKELADFLLHLTSHPSEYQKYFQWKKTFSIHDSPEDWAQAHCRLCKYLHTHQGESKTLSLTKWWEEGSECEFPARNQTRHLNLWFTS